MAVELPQRQKSNLAQPYPFGSANTFLDQIRQRFFQRFGMVKLNAD